MKKWEFTLGVDVSKNTLDISCAELNEHIQIKNGSEGFNLLIAWCKRLRIDLTKSILVMEYTGGYEYKLIQFCEAKAIDYTRIPGLAIKNSLGISRGKNDKVDSKRIAQYGEEKHKSLTPSKPLNTAIVRLKELLSFRKRLVRENASYQSTIKERIHMYDVSKNDVVVKILTQKYKSNIKSIDSIEVDMMKIVSHDEQINLNYTLITSIKGIGKVNGLMTIAYTENFTSFNNPRSYAVYVGVVPFDHSSGTSIKGRKRVSHIANKELKQELNQAARSALQWDKEMKSYGQKKLETKCYKIVLNNIKFKLILRMFAVVKKREMYVENYQTAA
ncbi:MAG: transposase [Bacteroidota bacterium]|nr:transposase [Bacteroidota bacterium]